MLRAWCKAECLVRQCGSRLPSSRLHSYQAPRLRLPVEFHPFTTSRCLSESPKADAAEKPQEQPKSNSASRRRRRAQRSRRRKQDQHKETAPPGQGHPTQSTKLAFIPEEANLADAIIQSREPADTPRRKDEEPVRWMTLQERLRSTSGAGVKSASRGAPSPSSASRTSDKNEKSKKSEKNDRDEIPPSEVVVPKRGKAAAKGKSKSSKANAALDVKTIHPRSLELQPIEMDKELNVPKLSHDLDRVLFNPGVYHMQDARSGVYNFDPYLASIMPADEFDYNALGEYITSSKDNKLRQLAAKHEKKYCGSTSSMTSILSHFHFLLSAWRKPNFENLSRSFEPDSLNYTVLTRGPAATFANLKDGVYAIDSDKQYDRENILSMLGKSMEKLLTLPKDEFEKYRRSKSHELTEEERNSEEAYHYTTLGDFMMRSQLDARDPRLPGSGVFDLKTRAVVTVRMDVQGYEKGVDYEIRKRFGQWESFEREYYDLIRAAFLKYSLQVRMGRMDGIFVAFHNTQRIFGFQYISLNEMDNAIHGTTNRDVGDQEFKASLALFNELLNKASERFPGKSLRLHVETRPTKVPLTYFFVEPVSDDEMVAIQAVGKPSVEQVVEEIRDLSEQERKAEASSHEEVSEEGRRSDESGQVPDVQNDTAWSEMMSKVEETVENESLGVKSVREALQDALEQSGLLQGKTEVETDQYLDSLVAALQTRSTETRELDKSREDSDPEGDPVAASSSTSSNADKSLKELILRVAERLEDKEAHLETFQRMFAGMPTESESDIAAETVSAETVSAETVSDAVEQASSEVESESEEDSMAEDVESSDSKASTQPQHELLGMYVTIRNQVNGAHVERPEGGQRELNWNIQYAITELPDKRARKIYAAIKKRRKTILGEDPYRSKEWYRMFQGQLPSLTRQGREYRAQRRLQEEGKEVYVAWDKKPLESNE